MTDKEALESARMLYEFYKDIPEKAQKIIDAFPELRESEDERCRKAIIEDYKVLGDASLRGAKVTIELKNVEEKIAWLEKQKEQKGSLRVIKDASEWEKIKEQQPAEWSEEDEEMINALIRNQEILIDSASNEQLRDSYSKEIQWLKSLRPQPHWKPSEEQMEALHETICSDYYLPRRDELIELYDVLKKL